MVILPDNAYREEIERALLVLHLRVSRSSDRVIWDYDTHGWMPGVAESPLPRPRARIIDSNGMPLVRLLVHVKKNVRELGRKKL